MESIYRDTTRSQAPAIWKAWSPGVHTHNADADRFAAEEGFPEGEEHVLPQRVLCLPIAQGRNDNKHTAAPDSSGAYATPALIKCVNKNATSAVPPERPASQNGGTCNSHADLNDAARKIN
ncbi:hypothetical protein MTO96_004591 [Rhipicephalus appendiculatus]